MVGHEEPGEPVADHHAEGDIEPDEKMLERASSRFNEKYSGPANAGRAMFLSGKAQVTQLGTSPREMDYQSGFDQAGRAIMAGHGTPPIAAGAAGSGSYAAYYAELKQFTELTIQPILDFLAEEDTERLAPQFGDGLTIEYEAAAIDDPDLLENASTATSERATCSPSKNTAPSAACPPSATNATTHWSARRTMPRIAPKTVKSSQAHSAQTDHWTTRQPALARGLGIRQKRMVASHWLAEARWISRPSKVPVRAAGFSPAVRRSANRRDKPAGSLPILSLVERRSPPQHGRA